MTTPIGHLTEEDLILHYYGESDAASSERHLASCATCRQELERLRQLLTLMDTTQAFNPAEAPGPAFERQVWARLAPQLEATNEPWWKRASAVGFPRAPRMVFVASLATLLIVAFLAGRFSRPDPSPGTTTATTASDAPNLAERILVVAVVDHLDRSQMVLLEILNTDAESASDLSAEQTRARELVTANRLYRQTAVQTGDDSTGAVLDELERTLLEIANAPLDASKDDLDALRARIASRGLLFKVRVVHSEMRERERQSVSPGSQS